MLWLGTYTLVFILLCLYHLFRLVCPFLLSDTVVRYQLVHPCLCSLTLPDYHSVLSLFSHCVGDFWERPADWDRSPYQLSRPTPNPPTPPSLSQHCTRGTRDEEQGTKGALSGPMPRPLLLLTDLSPSLEHTLIHRHTHINTHTRLYAAQTVVSQKYFSVSFAFV